jgi:hypothetical protein
MLVNTLTETFKATAKTCIIVSIYFAANRLQIGRQACQYACSVHSKRRRNSAQTKAVASDLLSFIPFSVVPI